MKRNMRLAVLMICMLVSVAVFSSFKGAPNNDASIKVYVENKCSKDVRIYVTQSGGGATYTVDHNSTKIMSLEAGQKIYDENQRNLIAEITSSSEGKTVVICN